MTVQELTDKLYEDGSHHPKKRVRNRCTMARCRRVATNSLANPQSSVKEIAELSARDDEDLPDDAEEMASELTTEEGYEFSFLMLLFPFIRILLEFLANRAKAYA